MFRVRTSEDKLRVTAPENLAWDAKLSRIKNWHLLLISTTVVLFIAGFSVKHFPLPREPIGLNNDWYGELVYYVALALFHYYVAVVVSMNIMSIRVKNFTKNDDFRTVYMIIAWWLGVCVIALIAVPFEDMPPTWQLGILGLQHVVLGFIPYLFGIYHGKKHPGFFLTKEE
jgi:hypothetical protein